MTPIEPEDLALVCTGNGYPFSFWYRDDRTAREIAQINGTEYADEHWWDADDDTQDALSWEQIAKMPNPLRVRLEQLTTAAPSTPEREA